MCLKGKEPCAVFLTVALHVCSLLTGFRETAQSGAVKHLMQVPSCTFCTHKLKHQLLKAGNNIEGEL